MTVLIYLIPIALLLGLGALFAFLWALKSGQYEDMEGEASRILFDDDDSLPKPQSKVKDDTPAPQEDRKGDGTNT